jgi:anaerobic ribonucleoside-triphosphate reductase activating protein
VQLRVALRVAATEAEGPGRRYAVWVQGCTLACPGCCNPEMFAPRGGELVDVTALVDEIAGTPGIEGLSILGGEPLQQAAAVALLASGVRARGLSVMLYTGFTVEEVTSAEGRAALAACDLVVDGRYVREQPESRRRWIGSANQRLHFLSDRYRADDPRFFAPNTVEIRLRRGHVTINGWPSPANKVAP